MRRVINVAEPCRIVVTGIGLCTPFGSDRESSWLGMLSGVSATRWLDALYWPTDTLMAGAPVCWPLSRQHRHIEPLVELALITASEALADAGHGAASLRQNHTGVVFGTSKGGLHSFARQQAACRNDSLRADRSNIQDQADDWLNVMPDRAASAIGNLIGGDGPVLCPVLACATGLAACLRGAELIRSGDCDLVLTGSADISLQPAVLGSFRRLGVLSRESADPSRACRPFDRHRSGFVIGEGAACLVLERHDSAVSRGATWYAEWLGGGLLSDACGLTQLDATGATLKRLLCDMRLKTGQNPDYINLHGTGTTSNDLVECRAVRKVFGSDADHIVCSSLKGGIGHLLGAAGSVELAATLLSIRDQIIPPTVNLNTPDPLCALTFARDEPVATRIDHAWKLSMGFGGHIAAACLGQLAPLT